MKKKGRWIDKYLTNNGKFDKTNSLYRRAYLLNAILSIMALTCLFFAIVDWYIFKKYIVAVGNMASVILSLLTLFFYKRTNKYKPAAYATVVILIIMLTSYFQIVQNKHFAFYWLAILPPIIYFLLERRVAKITLGLFGIYMLYFFVVNKPGWTPAVFDTQSIFNIIGASISFVFMIGYFEKSRREALNELEKLNLKLENNQNELRLILDSAAEAIYVIDLRGNCTFCNRSCLKMLGYNDESDLLGKNMHWQIHHTKRDGTPFPIEQCKVYSVFTQGVGSHVDDEVFWRADGTPLDVEYYSYPQIKNGEIIGAVVTFLDISERKRREAEIQYLSCYDTLTGLHNRRCFDENRAKIDNPDNLPLSVIFADINGLKMTNDIFGHTAGDELIKKSSEILQQACREGDVVARVGGDEFIILLPKTNEENAGKVLARIKAGFADARIEAIKCSVSLGLDVKRSSDQLLDEILANAENAMYKDKTMNRELINKDIVNTIIETLHARSALEKRHSVAVSELCGRMGVKLKLSEPKINTLKRAAYLHDIGKIILDKCILTKEDLTEEEIEKMRQHSVIGYRILNLFDDTLDLAEYVYGHHERWDGKGYPRGLQGEQIPLISRVILVTETYDRILNRSEVPTEDQKREALEIIRNGAGYQFDPKIVEVFCRMIEEGE